MSVNNVIGLMKQDLFSVKDIVNNDKCASNEMSFEDISYFIKWGLEWLIPASYENDVKEVKRIMGI